MNGPNVSRHTGLCATWSTPLLKRLEDFTLSRDEGAGLRELAIDVIDLWRHTVNDDHRDRADRLLFDAAATELSDLLGLEGVMRIKLYSDNEIRFHSYTSFFLFVFPVRGILSWPRQNRATVSAP